jgi:hypothetical protein
LLATLFSLFFVLVIVTATWGFSTTAADEFNELTVVDLGDSDTAENEFNELTICGHGNEGAMEDEVNEVSSF